MSRWIAPWTCRWCRGHYRRATFKGCPRCHGRGWVGPWQAIFWQGLWWSWRATRLWQPVEDWLAARAYRKSCATRGEG